MFFVGPDMYFYKTPPHWTIHAPAKLNLFFEVYGKRDDGYHEISSLAIPIRLFDTLTFEATEEESFDFDCFGGGPDVPRGEDNIVLRALSLLKAETGAKQGAKVRLFKRIPSQAGLGGGSGDAAAALLIARKAWSLDIDSEKLSGIAARIGSDCPIFLHRGASLSRGRGERIESIDGLPILHFVLLKPSEGLSTAGVYSQCMKHHDGRLRDVEEVVRFLRDGHVARAGQRFFNRLESAAAAIWPRFEAVKREMERLDCLAVRMSGSGTAFYGLCRNARHAGFVAAQLRQRVRNDDAVFHVAGP